MDCFAQIRRLQLPSLSQLPLKVITELTLLHISGKNINNCGAYFVLVLKPKKEIPISVNPGHALSGDERLINY